MKSALYSILFHGFLAAAAWLVVARSLQSPLNASRGGDGVALEWGRSSRDSSHARAPEPRSQAKPQVHAAADADAIALKAEPQAAAPSGGGSNGAGASTGAGNSDGNADSGPAVQSYTLAIRTRIENHLRYPLSLRRRGVTGTVLLALAIQPADGSLADAKLARGSGQAELDELALDAARRASPYGKAEALPVSGLLRFQLPIMFRVTQ